MARPRNPAHLAVCRYFEVVCKRDRYILISVVYPAVGRRLVESSGPGDFSTEPRERDGDIDRERQQHDADDEHHQQRVGHDGCGDGISDRWP